MTHTRANGQGQRSLGSKVGVETYARTDGRTEAIALPPIRATANGVGSEEMQQVIH